MARRVRLQQGPQTTFCSPRSAHQRRACDRPRPTPQGNTASATGCGRLLAQAIKTARAAGVTGQILSRAESAYYGWAFVGTALRHKTWLSVTARMTPSVTATITGIEATAWKPIEYPHAIFDEDEQRWVSDAEVTEVLFVAFTGRRKNQHLTCD